MTLISSCHWKTLEPFSLGKERPENTFFKTLIVNYHKIVKKENVIRNNKKLTIS